MEEIYAKKCAQVQIKRKKTRIYEGIAEKVQNIYVVPATYAKICEDNLDKI